MKPLIAMYKTDSAGRVDIFEDFPTEVGEISFLCASIIRHACKNADLNPKAIAYTVLCEIFEPSAEIYPVNPDTGRAMLEVVPDAE